MKWLFKRREPDDSVIFNAGGNRDGVLYADFTNICVLRDGQAFHLTEQWGKRRIGDAPAEYSYGAFRACDGTCAEARKYQKQHPESRPRERVPTEVERVLGYCRVLGVEAAKETVVRYTRALKEVWEPQVVNRPIPPR